MNYFKKLPKIIYKVWRNPKLVKDISLYLKNDMLAATGRFDYDYHTLFIAGLPKSGTTWVETQLARVPGYNVRPIDDPDSCTVDHNICDDVFQSLPESGYSVLKLHTTYSEENLAVIKRHTSRFIVMIRDLRDMCVSRYFHVKGEEVHRHYELYNNESLEDGLMHCIGVVEDIYVSWVTGWIKVINENPETILLVKYEELNQSPSAVFEKVFEFFHLPYDKSLMQKIERSKINKSMDLKKELRSSVGLRTKSTARKGIIGDWKNHFSPSHKKRFKEIAGDLLIELGYEEDNDW